MSTPTNADDLHAFLRTRRSIRRFKPDPVADSVIERILTTATYAPSAHNTQPWRFVIVTDKTVRARLGHALTSAMCADMTSEGAPEAEIESRVTRSIKRINEAPVLILLCRDVTAVREHKPQDTVMAIQSVANAATYLLLAAHAEGLGGNWICWPLYAQEETRKALELPETWEPQGMFFVGLADEEPRTKILIQLAEMMKRI
jgi:coenzyme F420-0:L-glutamate ligase / coenzyme F420-1:gamma-L-glutamate ligase